MPLRVAFDLDGVLADMESELVRQAEALFGDVATRRPPEQRSRRERPDAPQPPVEADTRGLTPGKTDAATDPGDPGQFRHGSSASPADKSPGVVKINMLRRQERKLWRHIATIENFWQSLNEIEPGVIPRLAEIAAKRRWEVIFLTKRPHSAGATAQVQSQRWLESKGFVLPSVYVVQESRGRIAAALGLDIVIDDRPENCLDVVVESKARAILVWRDHEDALPVSVRRLGIDVVKSVAECLDILVALDAPVRRGRGALARLRRILGLKEANQV